jgi:hypothetical protein
MNPNVWNGQAMGNHLEEVRPAFRISSMDKDGVRLVSPLLGTTYLIAPFSLSPVFGLG